MDGDPIARFSASLERASASETFDATRAALATADANGRPSVRFVLVRGHGPDGFLFYTNYGSRKARDLDHNPWAALAFHWSSIGEQIRIEGRVERADSATSNAYFRGRPRGSQLGAWASPQTDVLPSREDLMRRVDEVAARFGDGPIPRPEFWGGYRLVPHHMEFWIEGEDRLHDRFLFTRESDDWTVARLAP
jgi:pyridoxamine 5'-phosphate oxidase